MLYLELVQRWRKKNPSADGLATGPYSSDYLVAGEYQLWALPSTHSLHLISRVQWEFDASHSEISYGFQTLKLEVKKGGRDEGEKGEVEPKLSGFISKEHYIYLVIFLVSLSYLIHLTWARLVPIPHPPSGQNSLLVESSLK